MAVDNLDDLLTLEKKFISIYILNFKILFFKFFSKKGHQGHQGHPLVYYY